MSRLRILATALAVLIVTRTVPEAADNPYKEGVVVAEVVAKANAYKEGVDYYYNGGCLRARPFDFEDEKAEALWMRGYHDAKRRDRGRRAGKRRVLFPSKP